MTSLVQELRNALSNSKVVSPGSDEYAASIERWTKTTEKEAV